MLRLIFDDLQTACSDLEAYCKIQIRPSYGLHTSWLRSLDYEAGQTFWHFRHQLFESLVQEFPVLAPPGTPSLSTRRTKKLLHLPNRENLESTLSTMGRTCSPR